MNKLQRQGLAGILCAVLGGGAWAQQPPVIGGVYTCTDAKGRKLTADRPIAECADREQKVLNPSGTVKAKVGPSLTAQEKIELEQKAKLEAEERNRVAEEKRRDRALLTRYPNKGVHDQERAEALSQIDAVVRAATTRLKELDRQRAAIDEEMEFYKKDPSRAPVYLRRQQEENTQSQSVQRRFISEQEGEARRVNARFDDELGRLKALWAQMAPAAK
jgi:preprotein translocase subunit SecD